MREKLPARVDYADILRGLACLWVVLDHGWWLGYLSRSHTMFPQHGPGAWWEVPASIGYLGVSLFLTLSGFCLYYPIARRGPGAALDVRRFAVRRARRILPPYYATLAALVLLEVLTHDRDLGWPGKRDLIAHLFLVQNFSTRTVYTINPVCWSLALEWQWYCFFPVMVWLMRRLGMARTLGIAFAITTAWLVACDFRLGLFPPNGTVANVVHGALPGRLSEFVAGMVAAVLVTRPEPLPVRRRYIAAFGVVCAIPAMALVAWNGSYIPYIWQPLGLGWAALLVILGPAPRRHASRLARALVWVGGISYSLYLIHYPVLALAHPWLATVSHRSLLLPYALFALFLVPLTMALAWCCWWLTERPFLGRASAEGGSQQPVAIT